MRVSSSLRFSVLLVSAAAAVCGCSSAGASLGTATANRSSLDQAEHVPAGSTGANSTGARTPFAVRTSAQSARAGLRGAAKPPKDLFVSDAGNASVDVFANGTWNLLGEVTNGLNGPDGDWVDRKGNLYVANYIARNVTEYAPNATSPDFTYSTGLYDPINVAVDGAGNVYVSDFGNGTAGVVNVYAQGSNVVKTWCPVPNDVGGAEGVAIDANGNVFVAYNQSGIGPGQIAEYVGGLKGCNATILPVTLTSAGGIAIDANGNLIVCDQGSASKLGTVDVIAPPYNTITSQLGAGWTDPFHVALRRKDSVIVVADAGSGLVEVMNYPSGSVIKSLGRPNGVIQAVGVADYAEAAL